MLYNIVGSTFSCGAAMYAGTAYWYCRNGYWGVGAG